MSTVTLPIAYRDELNKIEHVFSEAENMHEMSIEPSETVSNSLLHLKARAVDNLTKLAAKEQELIEFTTLFQMMRSHQTDYFAANAQARKLKTSEGYALMNEALKRAKNAEERLDAKAVELLKRKA